MCAPACLPQFPSPPYQQLHSITYNRKSIARDQPEQDTSGRLTDSDGVSWIRESDHDGQHEWVIMEHDGPGCLGRIWTTYFYYNFNHRVGPGIRIYLDNSPEPVLNDNCIELLTGCSWPDSYGPRPKKQSRTANKTAAQPQSG